MREPRNTQLNLSFEINAQYIKKNEERIKSLSENRISKSKTIEPTYWIL